MICALCFKTHASFGAQHENMNVEDTFSDECISVILLSEIV